ncbi:zinc-binding dehydrogenase [Streptomyces liangshanensis]
MRSWLMADRRIDPRIPASCPLAWAGEALALVESGHAAGKVVIDMRL